MAILLERSSLARLGNKAWRTFCMRGRYLMGVVIASVYDSATGHGTCTAAEWPPWCSRRPQRRLLGLKGQCVCACVRVYVCGNEVRDTLTRNVDNTYAEVSVEMRPPRS